VRLQTVKGVWRLTVALAMVVLVVAGCELKPPAAQGSSPSTQASSPSPEATPVAITSPGFHPGEVTVAYTAVALAATGGTPPYQWTVGAGGALPGGLTLSPDGSVTGTPTAEGSFSFTVHVADTGGRTADAPGAIKVVPPPSAALTPACAQYCSVEQGCDSTCGPFGAVAGGTPPYTAAVQAGGYVPKGVNVTVAGPTLAMAGTFTTVAKFWQFTVLVTDSLGATATITPTFYVYSHLSLSSGLCRGNYVIGCTVSLPYAGGTPGGTPSVQITAIAGNPAQGCYPPNPGSTPPSGYTLTVSGGVVTLTIPKGILSGYGAIWTLVLTDQSPCAAGTYCKSPAATAVIAVQCG
jgi:hypothetical protein